MLCTSVQPTAGQFNACFRPTAGRLKPAFNQPAIGCKLVSGGGGSPSAWAAAAGGEPSKLDRMAWAVAQASIPDQRGRCKQHVLMERLSPAAGRDAEERNGSGFQRPVHLIPHLPLDALPADLFTFSRPRTLLRNHALCCGRLPLSVRHSPAVP